MAEQEQAAAVGLTEDEELELELEMARAKASSQDAAPSPQPSPEQTPVEQSPGMLQQYGDMMQEAATFVPKVAANMASSMVAKPVTEVMGMTAAASDLASSNPEGSATDFKQEVQQDMTYSPDGAAGAFVESPYNPINAIGAGVGAVADFAASFGDDAAGDSALGMLANATREMVIQSPALFGARLTKKQRLQDKQAQLDFKRKNSELIDTARNEAQQAGFITPAEKGVKAQISGVAKTSQAISQKNAVNATNIAKRDIGLADDAVLSGEALTTLKDIHYKAYDDVIKDSYGSYPGLRIKRTPEFEQTIAKHRQALEGLRKEYPRANKAMKIADELFSEQLKKVSHSPEAMMQQIKQLRNDVKTLYTGKANKIKKQVEAGAKTAIANALENMLDQHLSAMGSPTTMSKFRDARRQLAKINVIEGATNPVTGMLDIQAVKRASKLSRLDGGLKQIADFGHAFPKGSMSLKGAPTFIGLFDTIVAGVSTFAGHPQWAAMEITGRLGIPAAGKAGLLQNKTPSYKHSAIPSRVMAGMGATVPTYEEQ